MPYSKCVQYIATYCSIYPDPLIRSTSKLSDDDPLHHIIRVIIILASMIVKLVREILEPMK